MNHPKYAGSGGSKCVYDPCHSYYIYILYIYIIYILYILYIYILYIYINLLNTTIPLICNLVIIDSNYTINEYPITTYLLTYISIFWRDQCPMSFSSRARWPTKWLLGSSAKRPWVFRPSVFRPGQNMELSEVMWGKSSNKLVIICYNQWENFNGLGQPSFSETSFFEGPGIFSHDLLVLTWWLQNPQKGDIWLVNAGEQIGHNSFGFLGVFSFCCLEPGCFNHFKFTLKLGVSENTQYHDHPGSHGMRLIKWTFVWRFGPWSEPQPLSIRRFFPPGHIFFTGQEAHANAREVAPQLRSSWGGFHITWSWLWIIWVIFFPKGQVSGLLAKGDEIFLGFTCGPLRSLGHTVQLVWVNGDLGAQMRNVRNHEAFAKFLSNAGSSHGTS